MFEIKQANKNVADVMLQARTPAATEGWRGGVGCENCQRGEATQLGACLEVGRRQKILEWFSGFQLSGWVDEWELGILRYGWVTEKEVLGKRELIWLGHIEFGTIGNPGKKTFRQLDSWVYILGDRLMLQSIPKSWQTDKFNNKICFQFLLLNTGSSANKPSSVSVQQTFIENLLCSQHDARHWDHREQ